ncbi:MAG: hypothetical protein ACLUI3_07230 [Christensenellales bacterium]
MRAITRARLRGGNASAGGEHRHAENMTVGGYYIIHPAFGSGARRCG